jgi:hypothetical protein
MKQTEFHRLRQDVLKVEGQVIGIAKCIVGRAFEGKVPKADGKKGVLLAGDVSKAFQRELMAHAKREMLRIEDWRAHNYTSSVYGHSAKPFERARTSEYDANAASRQNIVPLIRGHFGLFSEPYVLNEAAIPEGMEMPARWARLHTRHSFERLSTDLDRIAEEAFAEMAAAIGRGADRAEVIDIHRQMLYGWIESNCLSVDGLRVDRYIGEIYRCGVFVPSKVAEVTAEDKEEGKISYRERLHTGYKARSLLAEEFQVIEHKIPDAA